MDPSAREHHSRKMPHVAMDADVSSADSKHHREAYFQDGDVVLHAVDAESKDDVLFRVHRFMLSHNSLVFRDMFALPTTPAVNEVYDGVPLVRMPDDANDLASLLCVLYNPGSLELRRYDPDIPIKHRGLLALAVKYDVDAIRLRIIQHMESEWPVRLGEWYLLTREMHERAQAAHVVPGMPQWAVVEQSFPEPASAIRMAIDFKIPSVLPAAYYRLAISNPGVAWGVRGGAHTRLSARWDFLECEDWRRYARGKQALSDKLNKISMAMYTLFVGSDEEECEDVDGCDRALKLLHRFIRDNDDRRFGCQPDVLGLLFKVSKEEYDEGEGDVGLCDVCKGKLTEKVEALLQDIWDGLPAIFNL